MDETDSQFQLLAQIEDAAVDNRVEEALKLCVKLDPAAPGAELRDWALRELRGYGDDDELPEYRVIMGSLRADWTNGFITAKREQLSPSLLPSKVRHLVPPELEIRNGIGVVLSKSAEDSVRLQTEAMQMAKTLLNDRNEYGLHLQSIYWTVSGTEFQAICSNVCTNLLDKIAPLKSAAVRTSDENKSAVVAATPDDAAMLGIHGGNNTITNVFQGAHSAAEVTASGSVQGDIKTGGTRQRHKTVTTTWTVRISIVLAFSAAATLILWRIVLP